MSWEIARGSFASAVDNFLDRVLPDTRNRFGQEGGADKANAAEPLLEHHTRTFILDRLLLALGWTATDFHDGNLNMLTEAVLPADGATSVRFLDYFGLDHADDRPLLVFEAKRFSAPSPRLLLVASPAPSLEHALATAARNPEGVTGPWKEYLIQIRTYVKRVKDLHSTGLEKIAVGNAQWLVVFNDPYSVFFGTDPNPENIFVVDDFDEKRSGRAYLNHFKPIYELLAYLPDSRSSPTTASIKDCGE